MEKHTEKILEFDRIKKMLEEYAVTGEARKALGTAEKDGLLYPEQLERMQVFAASCGRLIRYLKKACEIPVSLGYYAESMDDLEEVRMEINRCIRGSMVDDNATRALTG